MLMRFFVLSSIIFCGGLNAQEEDQPRTWLPVYAELETILEQAVKNRLKDPESAQFRDMKYWKFESVTEVEGGLFYVCGFVNAKNSFGGYNGYKPFYAVMNYEAMAQSPVAALDTDFVESLDFEGELFFDIMFPVICDDYEGVSLDVLIDSLEN